jgi:subfamily B ATP-binding cassette protein MsbA
MTTRDGDISWNQKLQALVRVSRYRPWFTVGLVCMGGVTALLEGIGLSFIYPILEVAQANEPPSEAGGILGYFLDVYQILGIPFTLEYLIAGVALAMTVRFTSSFLAAWLKAILRLSYEKSLRSRAFKYALNAEVRYFDTEGSDDILNAIITETNYSAKVIRYLVQTMETGFLALIYFSVMFYISPRMTVLAIILLGGITLLIRYVIEPGYTLGDRVAQANQDVQESVQSGTQGIRDVKLFGLSDEIYDSFKHSIYKYKISQINLARNQAGVQNSYDLAAALTLFGLIYVGFVYSGLSLGALSIFFVAMFRLTPLVSQFNSQIYKVEGNLSHLDRTKKFLNEIKRYNESGGTKEISRVTRVEFDDVHFSYKEEKVLNGITFELEKGEFIAFVGRSGAGKSTIVSLLTRMYNPDDGEIRADGVPIEECDIEAWRERIAVVRQNPFIFNDTLENNVTVGNRGATRSEVERVCEIANVDEFFDELPNGYESKLGDDAVRLSGGQRQRVALARALLKDADFLVLDEATSDLDSNLEKQVQAAIESMEHDYGIISIAHRLSTVKNADRIYTVDNGEIIEEGIHSKLLANNGEYADLHSIQSKG